MKNRDQRWAVVWSGLILSVLIPVLAMNLPLFKGLRDLDLFAYGIGLGMALTTVLAVLLEVRSAEARENVAEIKSSVESLELRVLGGRDVIASLVDRDSFYRSMQQFVEDATTRIDLMYQASKRPESFRPSNHKSRYLATLAEVTRKGRVPIRRLIRLTADNKEWIRELVELYSGKNNCSLSVLPESMVPSISIQLFDKSRVVLANLSESDAGTGRRNVIFESAGLTEVFEIYYEKVFKAADPLVENGRKHIANIGRLLS